MIRKLFIKRLVNPGIFMFCTSTRITLIPDNKYYPVEQLPKDEFVIIGQVSGVIEWR